MKSITNNLTRFLILTASVNFFFSTCTTVSKESATMKNLEGMKMTSVELSIRLNEFEKYFSGRVEQAADEIIRSSDNREIKINALQWKINVIPRVLESLVILDSRAAGIDIYALSGQMENFFKYGNGKDLFGEYQSIVVKASEDIMDEIKRLANDFRDESYRKESTEILNNWIKENPIEDIQFHRKSTFEVMAKTLGAEEYDIGSTVGSIEQGVQDIRRQITVYTEFLPKQTKWQAQLASYEILGDSVVEKTFNNMERVVNSTERITKIVEETPELVKDIQHSSFQEIDRQRLLTLTAIAKERSILIDEIRKERVATLKDINLQRLETLQQVEKIAEKTINRSFILAGDLIDKIFIRTIILVLIVFIGGIITLKLLKRQIKSTAG
jgi:hypothetical protein